MKIIKNKKVFNHYLLPACLILVLSFSRLIPHPWNFTPVLALGIFSGFYFRQFLLSFFIVVLAMFLGDLYLGFHNTMFFTYISLSLAVLIGLYIKRFNFKEILFSGFTSSICFYLITNFGAWITLPMYSKDLSGLINSYVLAVPFFHNTLISTFFYLILLKLFFEFAARKNIIKASS